MPLRTAVLSQETILYDFIHRGQNPQEIAISTTPEVTIDRANNLKTSASHTPRPLNDRGCLVCPSPAGLGFPAPVS